MTKIKMGKYNTVTPERFHLIKATLAEGMSDESVMEKYGIKRTTLRYIKKSTNFYEYRLLTEILPASRKMPKVVAPSSGLEFEDFSWKKKKSKPSAEKCASREDESTAHIVGIIAIVAMTVIGVVGLGLLLSFWKVK